MGYMHIDNLYKDSRIFQFDECYALEKIHGTSAHISWNSETQEITFFSGGEPHQRFTELFDIDSLKSQFFLLKSMTIYGEAYGGKQQGMKDTYGTELKFVVFDVRMGVKPEQGEGWLTVPEAEAIVKQLGLEFVDYVRIPTKLHRMDEERTKPSTQAVRNGITDPKEREGVVLRPIAESVDHRGNRIITKHKNDSFKETKTQREVDPEKLQVLADAIRIADEWVTEMRLDHVIDRAKVLKLQAVQGLVDPLAASVELDIKDTGAIVGLMVEDVKREAKGEIVESKDAMKAIGSAAARMFKKRLYGELVTNSEGAK
jgi:hypothetical protein